MNINTLIGRVLILILTSLACLMASAGFADSTMSLQASIDVNRNVVVSGQVVEGKGNPIAIRIMDPSGKVEYLGTTVSDQQGAFAIHYTLVNKNYGRYQVTVNPLLSANSFATSFEYGTETALKSLVVEGSSWDQAFNEKVETYNVTVKFNANRIKLDTLSKDPFAEISINGVKLGTGAVAYTAPVNVGSNAFVIASKALNGSTKTYRLNVSRAEGDEAQIVASAKVSKTEGLVVTGSVGTEAGRMVSIKVKDSLGKVSYLGSMVTGTKGTFNFKEVAALAKCGKYDILIGSNGSKSLLITAENIGLSDLKVSTGTLSPAFDPEVLTYDITLDESVDKFKITPQCMDPSASIHVDGKAILKGQASDELPISSGLKVVYVTVKGPDGTGAKTYAVKIKSAKKSTFNGNIKVAWDKKKRFSVSGIIGDKAKEPVNILIRDPKNNVLYIGSLETVNGGRYDLTYTMTEWQYGFYNISVGTAALPERLYTTFEIKKESPVLQSLALDNGDVLIDSKLNQEQHRINVPYATSRIKITPQTLDPFATIFVNDQELENGNTSDAIPIKEGDNQVTVEVTNLEGEKKQYLLDVLRQNKPNIVVEEKEVTPIEVTPIVPPVTPPVVPPVTTASSNATLSGLNISNGTLSPIFASGTTSYTASVANTVNSLTVVPTVSESHASVTVNQTSVQSGNASTAITLAEGSNLIRVVVTAQDGTMKTYSLTVTRAAAPSSNTGLSAIEFSSGTLNQPFATGTRSYTLNLPYTENGITIRPIAVDSKSSISVNGTVETNAMPAVPVVINSGYTDVKVVVTAENGDQGVYQIRAFMNAQDESNLDTLKADQGKMKMNPAAYTHEVNVYHGQSEVSLIPTAINSDIPILVNGKVVASNATSDKIALNGSETEVQVLTSAGAVKVNYIVTVKKNLYNVLIASQATGGVIQIIAGNNMTFDPSYLNFKKDELVCIRVVPETDYVLVPGSLKYVIKDTLEEVLIAGQGSEIEFSMPDKDIIITGVFAK